MFEVNQTLNGSEQTKDVHAARAREAAPKSRILSDRPRDWNEQPLPAERTDNENRNHTDVG